MSLPNGTRESTARLAAAWMVGVLPFVSALAPFAGCSDEDPPGTGGSVVATGGTSSLGGSGAGTTSVGGSGGIGQGGGSAGAAAGGSSGSVEGSFTHGSLVTVHGTALGSHPDLHPDDDKLIRMWEPFETGDFTSNPYGSWGLFNPAALEVVEDADTARRAAGDHFLYRRNSEELGNLEFSSDDHEEHYFSHWIRLSDGFDVCGVDGTHQWKGTRLTSANNAVNVYWAYGCDDGYNIAIEFTTPQILRWQTQITALPEPPARLEGWHRWDFYVKRASGTDSNDGVLQLWVDNERVYDFYRDTGVPYFDSMGFDSEGGDFAQRAAVGSYLSSPSADTWLDYDDLYISHTLARVELCDRPDLAASRHCELQEPVSWSDDAVVIRANRGTLPVGETAWLFVVGPSGVAASAAPVEVMPD